MMSFTKSLRPKVLVAAVALASACSNAAASTNIEGAGYDCAGTSAASGPFVLPKVKGASLSAANEHKLQRAACRVTQAAVSLEGPGSDWIRDIQVTAYVGSDRLPLDAYLSPGSSGKAPGVSITTAFVEEASEDELVALLGHEVSHALNDDASDQAYSRAKGGSQRAAGVGLVGGALAGKLVAASWAAGGVLGILGAGALYAHTQCAQVYQVEKTADFYGVRILMQEGYSAAEAVRVTSGMLEMMYLRNKPPQQNFWSCYLPGSMTHPTKADRIAHITAQATRI